MAGSAKRRRDTGVDLDWLEVASAADLRRLWLDRLGASPPPTLSARLMRLALAWHGQADRLDGETTAARRQWQAVMRRRTDGCTAAQAAGCLCSAAAQAGTRLMKAWGGETHEVIVLETGVLWQGRTYASLSAVARAMTGTPRNGPKFFGLRDKAS